MNFHVNHVFLSGIFDSFGPQWMEDGVRHMVLHLSHKTSHREDPPELIDVEVAGGVAQHATYVAWAGCPILVEGELVAKAGPDGVRRHAVFAWRVQALARPENRE